MKKCSYIVSAGWNRQISMFKDDPDALTLHPEQDPQGGAKKWHKEDILAMAFLAPYMLATSSYDGEIIISNIDSGHMIHRLKSGDPDEKMKSKSVDACIMISFSDIFTIKKAKSGFGLFALCWIRWICSFLGYQAWKFIV